ncbi:MAG TPA: hypothetical protein VGE54_03705 [Brevundimonas sp.]
MKAWSVIAAVAALGIAGCQQAALAGGSGQSPEAQTRTPAEPSTALGVTFDKASSLQTRPCGEEPGSRCVTVFDPAAEEFMRDLFNVEVHEGALDAVAAEEAGFVRNADGKLMTTYGRFMPVEVESFRVNSNPGLRAVISCGISDPETGFHAAGGECLWAVVSDGKRTAVIASSGFGNGLEAAEAAVASLRFLTDDAPH